MSRRVLQAVILLLSLLPLTFGSLGILFGADRLNSGTPVSADLDSQYRFLSAWYLGLAALAWWIVPRIEQQTSLFRILCVAVFLGGIARLLTIQIVGWPQTHFLVVHAAELLFPLLIVWQARISKHIAVD
jgi:Domain of unknown function (DUF4345)